MPNLAQDLGRGRVRAEFEGGLERFAEVFQVHFLESRRFLRGFIEWRFVHNVYRCRWLLTGAFPAGTQFTQKRGSRGAARCKRASCGQSRRFGRPSFREIAAFADELDHESISFEFICERASVLDCAAPKEAVQNSVHLAWLSATLGDCAASSAFFIRSALARPFFSTNSIISPTGFCANGRMLLAVRVAALSCSCQFCAQLAGLKAEFHQRPGFLLELKAGAKGLFAILSQNFSHFRNRGRLFLGFVGSLLACVFIFYYPSLLMFWVAGMGLPREHTERVNPSIDYAWLLRSSGPERHFALKLPRSITSKA